MMFALMVLSLTVLSQASANMHSVVLKSDETSVVLPCLVNMDIPDNSVVIWVRDQPRLIAYKLRYNRPDLDDHDQLYQSRTSLKKDAMATRDLSMTINNITLLDGGTYTCTLQWDGKVHYQNQVNLEVPNLEALVFKQQRDIFIGLTVATLMLVTVLAALTIKIRKQSGFKAAT